MMPGEKAVDFKGSMLKLIKLMGSFKAAIAVVFVFAIGSTVFNIVGPKVLSTATTELYEGISAKIAGTGGIDFNAVGTILLTTLALYGVSALCSFVQGWTMTSVSQKTCYTLRRSIAEKISRMPMGYFEKTSTGDVLSRITNDVDTLGQSLNQGITQLITSATTIVGVLAMMLSINAPMTLIALAVIPVSGVLVKAVVGRSQKYFRAQQRNIKKVVLAYSGGLDTSVILKWLQVNYGCEVITMTADVGQEDDLNGVDEKALRTGATKAYIEDLREEFAKDFIFPMLRSGALYEGRYLLGTSVARPLITKRLVEIARAEGADALAHGATGKGNDQVRFELSAAALAPDLRVIAPWREWDLMSRTALNFFAEQHNIPISSGAKHYSMDRNMLHCSFEGGELEDPWEEPLEASHIMAVPFEKAPDEAEYVTITFEHGDPVAVNGEALSPAQIMVKLNELGRKHGIGRVDMVENRFVGIKSRGVYETPGGTIIYVAHKDLEGITMERETMHIRDMMMPSYAGAIYNGFWYSPEREAMQAFIDKSQERVSGTVRLKLYKGNAWPVGRESKNTLYCADLATFEECATYDHKDAAGFIKLNSLRIRGYRKDLIK